MLWKNGVQTCSADEFSPSCEKARNSIAYKLCVCTTVNILCGAKFRLFYCRYWKSNQQRQRSISRPASWILSANASRTTAIGQTERETRLYTQPNNTLLYPFGAACHVKRWIRKLWICDVVTPQSCSRKWGKWTKRICEETSFLFWFIWGEATPRQIFSNIRHNFSANELASATVQSFEHKKWNPL